MNQPTKSGIYWFTGKHDSHYGEQEHSGPVRIDMYNHGDGPQVFFLGWDISEDLDGFRGVWIELTEEKVKSLK